MGICALCRQNRELKESHIIPKSVFNYLKASTGIENARFRAPLKHPNAVYQDGPKLEFLCGDCEEKFSRYEKYYIENVFNPYIAAVYAGKTKEFTGHQYTDQLFYFGLSLIWRVIASIERTCPPDVCGRSDYQQYFQSAKVMRQFLNCELPSISFPLHVFFFDKTDKPVADISTPIEANYFFLRTTMYGITPPELGGMYVYAIVPGMIFVGLIRKLKTDRWIFTRIRPYSHFFTIPQEVESDLFGYLIMRYHSAYSLPLPQKIKESLVKRLQSKPEKFEQSHTFILVSDHLKHR